MNIFNSFYLLDSCCQSLKWSLLGVKNRLGQVQIELRRVSRPFHMEFPPGPPQRRVPPLTQPHPHPLKYQENLFLSPLYSYVFTLQLPIHLCVKTSSFPGFSYPLCKECSNYPLLLLDRNSIARIASPVPRFLLIPMPFGRWLPTQTCPCM